MDFIFLTNDLLSTNKLYTLFSIITQNPVVSVNTQTNYQNSVPYELLNFLSNFISLQLIKKLQFQCQGFCINNFKTNVSYVYFIFIPSKINIKKSWKKM
jgi:hypothetical protein